MAADEHGSASHFIHRGYGAYRLEDFMRKLPAALLGIAFLFATLPSAVTPALALGGCGPNAHRNPWGVCVFGGQNQAWCLRHTGHVATPMPDGTLRCFR
jgi:hypothetical protein